MSQHTLSKLGLALLLAGTLVAPPGRASAATAAADLGDSIRPRIMKLAASGGGAELPKVARSSTRTASPSSVPAPRTSTPAVQRQVFGYVNAGNLGNADVGYTTWDYSLLTTVAYFGLHINGDGSINTSTSDTGWNVWNSATLTDFVAQAHAAGVKVVLSIVQQGSDGSLCGALSPASISTTVNTVGFQVNQKGVDGVNLDYEGPDPHCSTSSQASGLVSLASSFRSWLAANAPSRSNLTIATYAAAAEFPGGFFNIPGLAPYVDSFFVMAYDLDNSNFQQAPLSCSRYCFNPVGPAYGQPFDANGYWYNDSRAAATYRQALGSGAKVIMGVPYYGWTACIQGTVNNPGAARPGPNAYPDSTSPAWVNPGYLDSYSDVTGGDSSVTKLQTARDPSDQPQNQEPYATWWSTSHNCWREMYWDDPTSLGAKYDVVNSDDLAGAGLFALDYGGGDPGLWTAVALHFTKLPAAPGGVAACAGQTSASVSWSPAYSPHGAVTGYIVTAWNGGSAAATRTVGAGSTMATFTGLSSGTAYTFTVQATDAYGAGPGAASNAVTPWASGPIGTSYLAWYDFASPGMQADNLHLLARPGGATASAGCATVPGVAVLPFSIAPGQEQVLSFPHGVIGGPLTLTLFQGNQLLASQRVQYYHSFNEVPAQPATAAATSWQFAWFDHKSSPGFQADNLHLLNPAGSLSPAQVTLSIPGCSPTVSSFGSSELIYSCPFGSGFGGPVTISASVPVLASQRVQYYQSFNEEWAQNAAAAATSLQFSWYDHKSSPGFQADNLHVWNPAGTPFTATAQIPGCPSQSQSSTGSELLFSCTGGFSGPVTLTASLPVLASQRVQYYQSFNEVPAASAAQAATTLYQAWFDRISDPGFQADNLHVWNPAGAAFSVSVLIPGCASQNQDVAAGAEAVVTCAAGFGGPVVISSASPLLASQRVQYYQSFNEVLAAS